ncbi:hypothetical protein DACRYDRAFT_20074 [Dacryopinax primogenitus]|uniref:Extracellular membrane protein CFEM domain-containing protein n=1 Tax=Dacryopinax primogenitus (strain DJM 731) TaxID=1858805 RepID=M5GES9_DACPD|nr:uncharacterized protein DACRYDRAFT_20074 [Dacryopinax primogenitus]EJU05652.1 hypothetical protein DACRYDRAFT_20074 [Dacryopinax primogenitus]
MHFSLAALFLALPAIVNAIPSHKYDARFAALTVKHAQVAQRMANPLAGRMELGSRQSSCTTQCSSTADKNGITTYNACSSTDPVCICDALESLSATCLTCVLPAAGLSASQFSEICGNGATTTQCNSQCSDATDTAANQAADLCTTSSIEDPCVCSALNKMTSACLNCLLQISGISNTQFSQACAAGGSAGGSSGSPVGSQPTGGSTSCTVTACTSVSDQSGISQGADCSSTDVGCQCASLGKLSNTCLSCVLSSSGLTNQEYQAQCAASGSATATATTTTTAAPFQPTSSSSGGFSSPSCNSSCASSADQAAISRGNVCSSTDVLCACTAFNSMDSACLTCILSSNGLTQNDLTSQCAAASSQASVSSTAKPTGSNLPNTQNPTSGALAGFSIGIEGILGAVSIALGAMIFV